MLLAIDCGNTNIVFGLYDGDNQCANWRISTDSRRTTDEYLVCLKQFLAIENLGFDCVSGIIIACVVPEVQPRLSELSSKGFGLKPMLIGSSNVDLGIDVQIDRPEQVGSDRLVNAVALRDFFDSPAIVLDFGTATTLDLVGNDGAYMGGIIAPGVNLSVEALHLAAANLPRILVVPWAKDMPILGKDTTNAMRSGIFWGYVGMVEGLIDRLRANYGKDLPAVATGGLAPLFADHISAISAVDLDLTLKGLARIYEYNK